MKIKNSLLILSAVAVLGLTGCGGPKQASEDGSAERPFLIENKDDLIALQQKVNDPAFNGYVDNVDDAPYYRITNDIDLGGMEWEAIGKAAVKEDNSNLFSANIDGQGHTISNYKITNYDGETQNYGLFGAFHGYLKNLNVADFDINILPITFDNHAFVGGVIAHARQSALHGISAKGNIKFMLAGGETKYLLFLGGAVGSSTTGAIETSEGKKGAVTFNRFIDTNVNITSNIPDAFVGGVFGDVTTAGQAVNNISFVSAHGKIESAGFVGGITSSIDRFTTVTHAVVDSPLIKGKNLAGGIVGMASPDTVISNSVVAASTIGIAEKLPSYESIGTIYGNNTPINLPEAQALSSLVLDTVVLNTTKLKIGTNEAEDFNQAPKVASSKLTDATYLDKELGIKKEEFNISATAYPSVKVGADVDFAKTVNLNFVTNMAGITKEPTTISKYNFDRFEGSKLNKEGYTFKGWYYDEAKTIDYRFYLPMMEDTTLYGAWAKYSDFANTYASNDPSDFGMIMKFDDKGHLETYYKDHTHNTGSYAFYDTYIYFEIDSNIGDGGWPFTHGEWDKDNQELTFFDSSSAYRKWTYGPANDMVGFYRSANIQLDFLTNVRGTLYLPDEIGVRPVDFNYVINEDGTITGTHKVGDKTEELKFTVLSDGSINLVYNDQKYEGFTSVPFIDNYEPSAQTPWVGKTYRGEEYNENLGTADITFNKDGTVYTVQSNSFSTNNNKYFVKKNAYNAQTGEVTWTWKLDSTPTSDTYTRTMTKNSDGTYTYTEISTYYPEESKDPVTETNVVCKTMTMMVNKDGSVLYTGNVETAGSSRLFLEFTLNSEHNIITQNQYKTVYYSGAYFNVGNDVYVKSLNGFNVVAKYNSELDVFVLKNENKRGEEPYKTEYHLLAPHNIKGAFTFEGEEQLKDYKLYVFEGHIYLLNTTNGQVEEIKGVSNNFDNGTQVTLTIKGIAHTYDVTNLFAVNVLKVVK